MPERHNVGRALSHEEKIRLRKIAESRPEWQIARLAMTLALNTTMRACEIRGLYQRDVDFLEGAVIVRRSKTEAGERRAQFVHSMREKSGIEAVVNLVSALQSVMSGLRHR